MELNEEIRAYRLWRGQTQRKFAEEHGVSQQTVADWERGRSVKTLRSMEKLFIGLHEFRLYRRAMGEFDLDHTTPSS